MKKHLSKITFAIIFAICGLASNQSKAQAYDVLVTPASGNLFEMPIAVAPVYGQSFLPSVSGNLLSIDISMRITVGGCGGGEVTAITVNIYDSYGTGGNLLATSSAANVSSISFSMIHFTFPAPANLTANSLYSFFPFASSQPCIFAQPFIQTSLNNPYIYGEFITSTGTQPAGGNEDACFGTIMNCSPTTWYLDNDADGFGNANINQSSCTQPYNYVADGTDCNDGNQLVHTLPATYTLVFTNITSNSVTISTNPVIANQTFNVVFVGQGSFNNTTLPLNVPAFLTPSTLYYISVTYNGTIICSNPTVLGSFTTTSGCTPTNWYADTDGDTYGDINTVISSCTQPTNYVADNSDCNDNNLLVHTLPSSYTMTITSITSTSAVISSSSNVAAQAYNINVVGGATYSGVSLPYTVTGLTASTLYNLTMNYNGTIGCSNPTVNGSLTTSGTACPTPAMTTSSMCPTKATVNWTAGGPNYKVYWQQTSPTTSIVHTHSVNGATTYTFNITSQATYNVWVKTSCGGSSYSASSNVLQLNPVTFIAPPTGLTISNTGCHGFTATWNSVPGADSYILKYTLAGGSTFTRTGTATSRTLANLPLNASYTVSVASVIICNGVSTNCAYSSTVPASTLVCREGDFSFADPTLSDLTIYPNPSNGIFTISFENSSAKEVNYTVTNVLGQVIYTTVIAESEGTVNRSIDLNNVAAGIYSITIKTANAIVTKQFVVSK